MNFLQKKLSLFLLVLFMFSVFGSQPQVIFAHDSENKNVIIVHIDENGFEPKNITVGLGTEIIFENIGKEGHWPATNNHPSHILYDGLSLEDHCSNESLATFDSCEQISSGDKWSFVFEKTGAFSYHDHLWPHFEGEVIVMNIDNNIAEKKNIFSRFLDFIRKIFMNILSSDVKQEKKLVLNSGNIENELYENLKISYKNIVLQVDPREAIKTLREESSQDSSVSALCHDILHEIGHTAYRKYGDFKEAVRFQSDFCNSGYIHGIFESYFKSADDALVELAEQCREYALYKGRQFDLWQCYHGAGHGFMYLTGGDLNESLALCEKGFDKFGGKSCQNGAFMEVFNLEVLVKENDYITLENPFLTCSAIDIGKGDCYLYVPTYLSQSKGMDFLNIFKECDKAEFGYKSSCIHGVGSEAMKRNMNDPNLVFALCEQAGSSINKKSCVEGVVGMYMNQTGSFSAGEKLCEQAPQHFQKTCDNIVNRNKAFFREAEPSDRF